MSDKTLMCKDCSTRFVFSEREQAFYVEKGFQNEPQRCPECRKVRKQQKRSTNTFASSNRFGNRFGSSSYGNAW